jgi:uncharacterized Zn-finger protein
LFLARRPHQKLRRSTKLRRQSLASTEPVMADHAIPHFQNDIGVATIKVGVREFMCVGARPPFDHPHIFIDMGGDVEAVCGYCSTRYVYEPGLGAHSIPAECEFTQAA